MTRTALVSTAALLLLMIGAPLRAQPAPELGAPCADAMEAYCSGVPMGVPLRDCLRAHDEHLSEACRQSLGGAPREARGQLSGCEADAKKLCTGEPLSRTALVKCLRNHELELSEACRKTIADLGEK